MLRTTLVESPLFQPSPEDLNIPGAGLQPRPCRAIREGRREIVISPGLGAAPRMMVDLSVYWGYSSGEANSVTHVPETTVA